MFRSLATLPRTCLAFGALAVATLPSLAFAQGLPPVSLPSTKPAHVAKPVHHVAKPAHRMAPAKTMKPAAKAHVVKTTKTHKPKAHVEAKPKTM